jgi:hypothetical protein
MPGIVLRIDERHDRPPHIASLRIVRDLSDHHARSARTFRELMENATFFLARWLPAWNAHDLQNMLEISRNRVNLKDAC